MLKVGVTGGIGAGKSIVCRVFKTLGIPVFDADAAAKMLMEEDPLLVKAISNLFGNDVYISGKLDREKVASMVFNQPTLLKQLNKVVHPATISYGNSWMQQQTTSYVIKEAAIFFESGSYKEMDVMIGVFAPVELRIKRVLTRPGMTREKVLERMANQIGDEQKLKLCDYTITNDDVAAIIPQVESLHKILVDKAAS